ncbi:MAG: carboxypeptidase regulatory-like domain-containing protein [Verrucomicrobia bacterium]|nr:carboxypeptidase regulatory-like domain-containing protein [Verrucomicrobiota bacterium]MCF7707526.1 carboxypeptidase regulatory-like domain-containing protein [Verrucomicrobiota bacterium]
MRRRWIGVFGVCMLLSGLVFAQDTGKRELTGTVIGPDGEPAEGVNIRMIPNTGGMQGDGIVSDEDGRFKVLWDPTRASWAQGEFYVIATHLENKLAGVTQINEDTREVTINLVKGAGIEGKVVNENGEPIVDARVVLQFWGSNYGVSFGRETTTNDKGEYQFDALFPDWRYSVNISKVEGYGSGRQDVWSDSTGSSVEVENIVLKKADRKVSGQVIDINGNGIADVRLSVYGQGQPHLRMNADKDGYFEFDGVCAGEISINGSIHKDGEYLFGNVRTQGGAKNIKLILTEGGATPQFVPKTPSSLVGKTLPDLTTCDITMPADAGSILVFAWDMNQRSSRHFVKQLAANADVLNEHDVIVVLLNTSPVDKEQLKNWLDDNQIHYPCGVMDEDAEDMKFEMGIQSLPWLILTDPEHEVIAEGFSVEELGEKLKEL